MISEHRFRPGPRLAVWMGTLILAGAVALPTISGPAQEKDWARLRGEQGEGSARLLWDVTKWPAGLTGFEVRRRSAAGPWEAVTRGAISPGLVPARDLSAAEPDPEERRRLEGVRAKVLEAKQLKASTSEEFIAEAGKGSPDFFKMLRVIIQDSTDLAYLYGFACTDRAVPAGQAFEYGLFAVYGARVDADPVATYAPARIAAEDVALKVSDLRTGRSGERVWLRWTFPRASLAKYSIRGFHVYRAPKGGAVQRLTTEAVTPDAPRKDDGGQASFDFVDPTSDAAVEYEYSLAAVGAFGREYPGRTSAAYSPTAAAAPIPGPTILSIQDRDGRNVVTWEFPKDQEAQITGFRIEVSAFPGGEPEIVAGPHGPADRTATDRTARKPDVGYLYRVISLKGEQVVSTSKPFFLLSLVAPVPPTPTGLKAEPIQVGNRPAVRLSWNPKAAGDTLTEGYVLYADHPRAGEVILQASIGTIRGTEHVFSLDVATGREYTLGIAAVAKGGGTSPRIEVKSYVAGTTPPDVADLKALRQANGSLQVTWSYPAATDVKGFRVYRGAELLADEKTLAASARAWNLAKVPPTGAQQFVVRAVSHQGEMSRITAVEYLPPAVPGADRPLPPTGLKAERAGEGAQASLVVTWTPDPTVAEYRISTDLETYGDFPAATKVPAATPGRHALPLPDPKRSVTVRLWAANARGATGAYSEALALGQGRTLEPAVLGKQFEIVRTDAGIAAELRWRYPANKALAGFRIYKDQAPQPVVDEKTLGPNARTWTTGILERGKNHVFEIVAVGAGELVSERGPARTVIHFQR